MHQPLPPEQESAQEYGAPPPQPTEQQSLPPGGGRYTAPHFLTFSQIVNSVSRTYRWTFDEALRHNRNNALAIRRDPVVMDALRSRQIPTAQLPWHIEPENDKDTRQAEAAQEITKVIKRIPNFQRLKMHLLEALWWGRYGAQLLYEWDFSSGKRRLAVRDFRPINGDKLVFKHSGASGILVHATYPGTWEVTDRGRAHFFDRRERQSIILHKHEPEDADFFEPELAGSVAGVGIRSRIYWFWWLRSQVSAFLMDYLERVGAGGFTVYYYEAGNPSSRDEVKAAAEEQHRNNTILFPRYRDGSTGGPGVLRIEASNAGAQLLQTLISGYFDEVIRRYILGQNLTSETAGTGLGSGVADLHADTFSRLVKYDAINLAETLTTDLVWVLQEYMYPDLPKMQFVFDVDKPNARDVLEAAQGFYNMGGTVDEDELRSIIGLAKPQPGHPMLAKMGNLSPAGIPMGVPMMGPPGPDMGVGADPQGMSGMGAPMQMSRRRARPYARRFVPGLLLPHEQETLRALARHRDADVQAMAVEALRGDTDALMMLHDALIDAGDDATARRLLPVMGYAARVGFEPADQAWRKTLWDGAAGSSGAVKPADTENANWAAALSHVAQKSANPEGEVRNIRYKAPRRRRVRRLRP